MTEINILDIKKQFNRVRISIHDMEIALSYLDTLLTGTQSDIIKRSLITSAIVAYARPFSGNENHEKAISNPPLPKGILDVKEKELHERILVLRNTAIAHSDYEMYPSNVVEMRQNGFQNKSRFFDILSEPLDLAQFKSIAEKLKEYYEGKLFELSRKGSKEETTTL